MESEIQAIVNQIKDKFVTHGKLAAIECVELIPAALEIAAKKTSTPIDDVVVAALKEPMKAALKDLITKL